MKKSEQNTTTVTDTNSWCSNQVPHRIHNQL